MPRQLTNLPPLIRFLLTQFLNGAVLGLTFGLALIWLDIAGVGRLLNAVDPSALVTLLYFIQSALLFGTLHASVAVLYLDSPDD